jgi:hypothetical protein
LHYEIQSWTNLRNDVIQNVSAVLTTKEYFRNSDKNQKPIVISLKNLQQPHFFGISMMVEMMIKNCGIHIHIKYSSRKQNKSPINCLQASIFTDLNNIMVTTKTDLANGQSAWSVVINNRKYGYTFRARD